MNQLAMMNYYKIEVALARAQAFLQRNRKAVIAISAVVMLALFAAAGAHAATAADTWATAGYTFMLNAAQGFFVRGICIVGGLLAMISAAGSGKYVTALGGVALAIFGFLSPTLINAIFTALV